METNNNQVKGIMVNGWYAVQDDTIYLWVDQYIDLGTELHLHYTKRTEGKEDKIEECDGWYSDFEACSEDARFYDTLAKCINVDNSVMQFREVKGKMEKDKRDKVIVDFLKEYKNEIDQYGARRYFEMAGYNYNCLTYGDHYDECDSRGEAIKILNRGSIRLNMTSGTRFLPINQVVSVMFANNQVDITMSNNERIVLLNKDWPDLYKALKYIYDTNKRL